ncbi:MAG: hypothetical protein AB8B87_12865 [Granulosicoccus sp.]
MHLFPIKRFSIGTLIAAIVLASCSTANDRAISRPDGVNRLDNAMRAGSTPFVIADFRTDWHLTNESAPTRAHRLDAVYGSDAPDDVRTVSSVEGTFTRPDSRQTLVVLNRGEANASSPEPRPSMVAIFENDKLLTQFLYPDTRYDLAVNVKDVDGDRLDDILFTRSAYQMGTLYVSAEVVGFANANRIVLNRLGQSYINSCDSSNPDRDIKAARFVMAQSSTDPTSIAREPYRSACPSDDNNTSLDSFHLFNF